MGSAVWRADSLLEGVIAGLSEWPFTLAHLWEWGVLNGGQKHRSWSLRSLGQRSGCFSESQETLAFESSVAC